jgi:beta-galactosidase
MTSSVKGFFYGSTYPPLMFDEAEWEQDLTLMAEAKMNIVRIGDVGTWDRIESVEGQIDLEVFQRFYSLAHRFDIQVLLSTGTASPPLWLAQKDPTVRILSSRGERYPLGASYHWACIHNPNYLAACQNYIGALAEFAIQQPNHAGWQIGNEIGFPFNPTRESGEIDLYCYCDHSREAFSVWLAEKYGAIDALTTAWSWGTTNFVYHDWKDAFPPEALPKSWSSVTRWMDWRLFWQQAFADHVGWQHEQIRSIDQVAPTSVNTFNFKSYDRFGTYTGLDQWKIAKQVDHIGYDLYPGSGAKLASRPEHNSIFLDHGRSVSRYAGTDFWLHELESGPIGGWLLGPEHNTSPEDIFKYCFESIGHDGKLLVYMPWKEWLFQPLHWGAIVDLEGTPTARYDAAAAVGRYIEQNSEFLQSAKVHQGEAAILETKSNAIFLRGVGQEDLLFTAQRGAYRSFWDQDFQVDFLIPEMLTDEHIHRYQCICMPLTGVVSNQTISALRSYVEAGGVLLVFARAATVDTQGWFHSRLPTNELGELLGLHKIEADTNSGEAIVFNGTEYPVSINRDLIYPNDGVDVLASFKDGFPAITSNSFSRGLCIYIATQADSGRMENDSQLLPDVIKSLTEERKFRKRICTEFQGKSWRSVDHHLLDNPQRSDIFLISYEDRTVELQLTMSEDRRKAKTVLLGMLDLKEVPFTQSDKAITLNIDLPADRVECIQIHWEPQ